MTAICKRRLVKVDGKIRTDPRYPAGLMDVIELGKSNEQFRLIYDCKGRYCAHKIEPKEAEFKLCRVNKWFVGDKKVTHIVTHDGRTIRYAHPDIRLNDTVKYNLKTGEVDGFLKFKIGSVAMVTEVTSVGSASSATSRSKPPVSTSSTSRTLPVTSSPPGRLTCSSLAMARTR